MRDYVLNCREIVLVGYTTTKIPKKDKYYHTPIYGMWEYKNSHIYLGGEGGIRTREPLRVTRSPGVRVRPDYATSPNKKLFNFLQLARRIIP